jgi:thioredoxin 1
MNFPKIRFIGFALIGCIATLIILNQKSPDLTPHSLQMEARPVDLSAYLSPLANYGGNVKTRKVAPLILLDDTAHFKPLQELIQGRMLLDFNASWCGPCVQQGHILDEVVATEELGTSVILKIDIDQHPALAQQFNVVTIPKLVLLEQGKIVHEQSGIASRETVLSWLSNKDNAQLAQVPIQ